MGLISEKLSGPPLYWFSMDRPEAICRWTWHPDNIFALTAGTFHSFPGSLHLCPPLINCPAATTNLIGQPGWVEQNQIQKSFSWEFAAAWLTMWHSGQQFLGASHQLPWVRTHLAKHLSHLLLQRFYFSSFFALGAISQFYNCISPQPIVSSSLWASLSFSAGLLQPSTHTSLFINFLETICHFHQILRCLRFLETCQSISPLCFWWWRWGAFRQKISILIGGRWRFKTELHSLVGSPPGATALSGDRSRHEQSKRCDSYSLQCTASYVSATTTGVSTPILPPPRY